MPPLSIVNPWNGQNKRLLSLHCFFMYSLVLYFSAMENSAPIEHFDWNLYILGPTFVVVALIIFIFYVVTTYKANQMRHQKEKERLNEQFSIELDKARLEIHELTLKRIASEIHDNIGHNLTVASMNLALLKFEKEHDLAEDTKKLVHSALDDLRNLSRSLNSDYMMDLGLEGAIKREIALLSRSSKWNMRLECHQIDEISPVMSVNEEQIELIFFRCAQEALSNIVKYAFASEVNIELWFRGDTCVRMEILDNGIGIDPITVYKGIGFRSMEQRMFLLNGKFEMNAGNPGTHLTFVLEV
jgi:signal transduction histidine kinase